jgi:hypothetical protein
MTRRESTVLPPEPPAPPAPPVASPKPSPRQAPPLKVPTIWTLVGDGALESDATLEQWTPPTDARH